MKNKELIEAINKYGRKDFAANMQCSMALVNSVCGGKRQFGVVGNPSMVDKACLILDVPYSMVRPDIYKE